MFFRSNHVKQLHLLFPLCFDVFFMTFGDFWMACQPKMGNILTTYDGYDIQVIPAFFSKMARRSCQFFLMELVGRLSDSGMQAWFCLQKLEATVES
jgi:hypothetical protein